jgi:hypothetical protein
MSTMYADHDRDERSRIWKTDIGREREHLLKGSSASISIETLERSRKAPTNSSHYSSASAEVEIHRGKARRPSGDRKPLAY